MMKKWDGIDFFGPEMKKIMDARLKALKFTRLQSTKDSVFAKYGKKCLCCGSETNIQLDHVIPVIKDGACDDINNLQPLCKKCNSSKGRKTIDYRPKEVVL